MAKNKKDVYGDHDRYRDAREAARLLLVAGDPNPDRADLLETPDRIAKAWIELTGGQHISIPHLFKTFAEGRGGDGDLVSVCDIQFTSLCEHHGLPFYGTADIAVLPGKTVLGLSKYARLVDAVARRLQTQERITAQVADALVKYLKPQGVMVILRAEHSCMRARGVKNNAHTITSAVRGKFKTNAALRAEFLSLRTSQNQP